MKLNPLIWFCLVCMVGFACCTAEVLVEEPELPAGYVQLSIQRPGVTGNAQTKSGGTENLPTGATVRIAAYQRPGDALTTPVNISTTAPTAEATYNVEADGSLSLSSASPLIVSKGTYDFYAISPARSLSVDGGTYQISDLQRGEDVMTSYAQEVKVSPDQKTVTLKTFTRQCARVVIKVVPATTTNIPLTKLSATSATLTNMSAATASLTVGTSAVIQPTAGNEFSFANFTSVPSSEGPNLLDLTQASNIIFPKSADTYTVRIQIDYQREGDAQPVEQTLQATLPSQAFVAGNSYLITLTVDNNESTLSVTVKSWDETITIKDDNMGGEETTTKGVTYYEAITI